MCFLSFNGIFCFNSCFLELFFFNSYIIAIGLECGKINVYTWKQCEEKSALNDWTKCLETDNRYAFWVGKRVHELPRHTLSTVKNNFLKIWIKASQSSKMLKQDLIKI